MNDFLARGDALHPQGVGISVLEMASDPLTDPSRDSFANTLEASPSVEVASQQLPTSCDVGESAPMPAPAELAMVSADSLAVALNGGGMPGAFGSGQTRLRRPPSRIGDVDGWADGAASRACSRASSLVTAVMTQMVHPACVDAPFETEGAESPTLSQVPLLSKARLAMLSLPQPDTNDPYFLVHKALTEARPGSRRPVERHQECTRGQAGDFSPSHERECESTRGMRLEKRQKRGCADEDSSSGYMSGYETAATATAARLNDLTDVDEEEERLMLEPFASAGASAS